MPRWLKIIIGIFVSIAIVLVAAGLIFYKMLNSSLPLYEGNITAEGLINEVDIYRDSLAVPYILAENEEDAVYALGYVHAQERMFTMDIMRRAGAGRLSEIMGSRILPFDKMFLASGIKKTVNDNIKNIDAVSLKLLNAYSRGVNQYLKDYKGKLPVEFDVLGYEPYEWKPEHSLIIGRMMAWELNISWWADITYTLLVQKLGIDKAKLVLPDYPENAPYIIPPYVKNASPAPLSFLETDRAFRELMGFNGTHIGSNSWVVNKNKSSSGQVIMANDPHLAYSAPGKWMFVVIKGGDLDVSGFTLPGVPAVVIGKNKNISWVLTNIMTDDADFYIEHLSRDKTKYLFNSEWRTLSVYTEKIKIKDSADVTFTIRSTHRGPIINQNHPYSILYPEKILDTTAISMRWLGNDFSNEFAAFYGINKAKNFSEFREALNNFSVPGQNFIYGDREGNIGYVFGGQLPLRNSNSPTLVFDGSTDEYDWQGLVPQSELPVLYNPPQNFIASANNKTIKDYKYHISNLWEPSSRMDRITDLLNSKEKHSSADFKKYQMDIKSPYAEKLTKHILAAFADVKITDVNLLLAIELFDQWDFVFDDESQVPAIYAVFFQKLMENIYKDEMGNSLFNEYVMLANLPYRNILDLLDDSSSVWFDNVNTSQVEDKNMIVRKSLSDALGKLESEFGKDLKQWQWGKLHYVVFKHAFSGFSSLLDRYVNIGPEPIGGDGTTIFNTEYSFHEPIKAYPLFDHGEFENDLGPSMRYIYDFAKPDEIQMILTTGESGNVMSDHFRDMSKMWLKGKYLTIKTDETSIRRNKVLRLKP